MPHHPPLTEAPAHLAPGLGRTLDAAARRPRPSARTSRALVKRGATLSLESRTLHDPEADDVRLTVAFAGLCRTDVYAAEGLIPTADPVVLGHEFSATVDAVGPNVTHLAPGDRVAVFPWIGCARCEACAEGAPQRCDHAVMLGVRRDGAFADHVTLPARAAFPIPDTLSLTRAAYAEPIAAALAILDADIHPAQRGLLVGHGRIADLSRIILRRHAFTNVHCTDRAPTDGRYDFAIETRADDLEPLCAALRPGGLLVVKSRPASPSLFPHALAVRKELRLQAVHYAPFPKALALLADLGPEIDAFIDTPHPLEDYPRLFASERQSEHRKLMFELAGEG